MVAGIIIHGNLLQWRHLNTHLAKWAPNLPPTFPPLPTRLITHPIMVEVAIWPDLTLVGLSLQMTSLQTNWRRTPRSHNWSRRDFRRWFQGRTIWSFPICSMSSIGTTTTVKMKFKWIKQRSQTKKEAISSSSKRASNRSTPSPSTVICTMGTEVKATVANKNNSLGNCLILPILALKLKSQIR